MWGVIKTDLRKSLLSVNFLLSCTVMLTLIFSAGTGSAEHLSEEYSILGLIFKTNKDIWLTYECFSAESMFLCGFLNQWTGIFIPFLAAFACVPIFCDEFNSNCWRHSVGRIGVRKYIGSKFFCSIIVSFALIIICYTVFAAVCFGVFPSYEQYAEGVFRKPWYEYYGFMRIFNSKNHALFIVLKILSSSIVASVGGLFCLVISGITMNKYISLGIPVLIYFFFAQVSFSLTNTGNQEDVKFVFLNNSSRFATIDNWFTEYTNLPLLLAYLYFFTVGLLFFTVYFLVLKRRLRQ